MTDTENTIAPELLNDERALRLSKREDYIARGVNPYPEHSEVTDYVRDIVAKYADLATGEDTEDVVKIGGRIVAKRGQGKIMFLVVRDTTADIQLFCRINDMSEADWELLRNLDPGRYRERRGRCRAHEARRALHRSARPYAAFQSCASAPREVPRSL